jgi:transposase
MRMSGNKRKQRRPPSLLQRIDVRREEIAAILERTRAVLSAAEHATLSTIVDTLALVQAELQTKDASLERLRKMIFGASTEKTRNVLGEDTGEQGAAPGTAASGADAASTPTQDNAAPRPKVPGHGRNGAAAYTGADQVTVAHPDLHGGEACPGCASGKLYPQSEPAKLVRITGMGVLPASVHDEWRDGLIMLCPHSFRVMGARHGKIRGRDEEAATRVVADAATVG